MDAKEEGILLGELKEFKRYVTIELNDIKKEVKSLNRFKLKVTLIMAVILGTIEIGFRAYQIWYK